MLIVAKKIRQVLRISMWIMLLSLIHTTNSWIWLLTSCGNKRNLFDTLCILGYTTQIHGSHNGGVVDAIQLETPKHLRNKEASPKYAKDIAVTIHQYLQLYYETETRKQAQL